MKCSRFNEATRRALRCGLARLSPSLVAFAGVLLAPQGQAIAQQELFKLIASDGAVDDIFGFSVSTNGDRAIVGAYQDDDDGSRSGSAYVFDLTTEQELFKLTASEGDTNNYFGYSVSIDGDRAIVGAQFNVGNGSY